MRKTPKEIAECHNQFEQQDWLLSATTDEICGFFTYTAAESHIFQFAKAALEIRISENAEQTAKKLVTGTDRLVTETETLVKLTHRLYILTIVLIVLGSFEIFKFLFSLISHN